MYTFTINTSGASVLLLLLSSLLARGMDWYAGSPVQHPQQGFHRNCTGSASPPLNSKHPLVTEPPTATWTHKTPSKKIPQNQFRASETAAQDALQQLERILAPSKPMNCTKTAPHSPRHGEKWEQQEEAAVKPQVCTARTRQLGRDAMVTERTTFTPEWKQQSPDFRTGWLLNAFPTPTALEPSRTEDHSICSMLEQFSENSTPEKWSGFKYQRSGMSIITPSRFRECRFHSANANGWFQCSI